MGSGTPSENTFLRGDEVWAPAVPAGVICMWAELLNEIPAGWALADGQNGTPDLRSRFIKGAGPGAQPGATGGSPTHQHTYTDVITHTHGVNVTDPGHTHTIPVGSTDDSSAPFDRADAGTNASGANATNATGTATTGITAGTSAPAGAVATGVTSAASSEPAYFTSAFIVKL